MTIATPLETMFRVLAHVACDRASRERRPVAIERDEAAWTVRPAGEATPAGSERLEVVAPGEAPMGVCKRFYGNAGKAPEVLRAGPRKIEQARTETRVERPETHSPGPMRPTPPRAAQSTFTFGD